MCNSAVTHCLQNGGLEESLLKASPGQHCPAGQFPSRPHATQSLPGHCQLPIFPVCHAYFMGGACGLQGCPLWVVHCRLSKLSVQCCEVPGYKCLLVPSAAAAACPLEVPRSPETQPPQKSPPSIHPAPACTSAQWAAPALGPPVRRQVHLPFPTFASPSSHLTSSSLIPHARIIAAPTAALVRALLIFLNAWCDSSYASRVELACWSWPSAPLLPASYPASCVAFVFLFAASIRCVFPLMGPPAPQQFYLVSSLRKC